MFRSLGSIQAEPRVALLFVDFGQPDRMRVQGSATVSDDPSRVAEAVRRYALRYRQPAENPSRVVLELAVDRVLGRG